MVTESAQHAPTTMAVFLTRAGGGFVLMPKERTTHEVSLAESEPEPAAEPEPELHLAQFIAAERFAGAKPGYAFQRGDEGQGYYLDANTALAIEQRPREGLSNPG